MKDKNKNPTQTSGIDTKHNEFMGSGIYENINEMVIKTKEDLPYISLMIRRGTTSEEHWNLDIDSDEKLDQGDLNKIADSIEIGQTSGEIEVWGVWAYWKLNYFDKHIYENKKVIKLTENEFKQIIENIILKEEEEGKYQVQGSDFKEQFNEYIERIKGMSQGIDKTFTAMDDVEFDDKTKNNFINDIVRLRDLCDRMIEKVKENKDK